MTCSKEVLPMLERTLANVEPILEVDTQKTEPLIWQNKLTLDRLHQDEIRNRLGPKDLQANAAGFFEDYIAVGVMPEKKAHRQTNK